jgi:hypothetical protein
MFVCVRFRVDIDLYFICPEILKLAFGLVLQAWRYIFVYKSCECDVEASIKAKYWW